MTASPQPAAPSPAGCRTRLAQAALAAALAALVAVGAGCGGHSATAKSGHSGTSTPPHTATTSSTTTGTPATTASTPSTAGPSPPTIVNSNCKPPAQHPDPIVLVPGTFGDTSWQLIAPNLAQLGYCVYTFTYGRKETGDIPTSARELASWVKSLLTRTGASRVSIVGHSQGGMMPRYYIKFLGGASKVDKLVALAPSNDGTLNPAAFGGALAGCVACEQQETGSPFLANLDSGDEAPPPVYYTVIETMYDEVVIPYTSAFLTGPATRVTNVLLQQRCPNDFVGHVGLATNPVALEWVENALAAKNGPADLSFVPSC